MKCLCGYEHEERVKEEKLTFLGTWHREYETVKGDEPFIEVAAGGAYLFRKPSGPVNLIACPKCGTVKIA